MENCIIDVSLDKDVPLNVGSQGQRHWRMLRLSRAFVLSVLRWHYGMYVVIALVFACPEAWVKLLGLRMELLLTSLWLLESCGVWLCQGKNHVWKWFDDRSGRWTNYGSSNNKSIDDAYREGKSSVRLVLLHFISCILLYQTFWADTTDLYNALRLCVVLAKVAY